LQFSIEIVVYIGNSIRQDHGCYGPVADRSVSVSVTLNDLERLDSKGQLFSTDLCNNYARTV